tara:strand:+ start:7207 stop:7512 length:306 start_codon:yes stop_codon:yes gene_type:complete
MEINTYTLETLQQGQKGIIRAVDSSDPQVQRLMVLGLVEGAEIEHATSAIGGDPIEFRLYGTGISLRREHARHFTVIPQSDAAAADERLPLGHVAAAGSGG